MIQLASHYDKSYRSCLLLLSTYQLLGICETLKAAKILTFSVLRFCFSSQSFELLYLFCIKISFHISKLKPVFMQNIYISIIEFRNYLYQLFYCSLNISNSHSLRISFGIFAPLERTLRIARSIGNP